jgi:OmpA-OmpF porin, OOP family
MRAFLRPVHFAICLFFVQFAFAQQGDAERPALQPDAPGCVDSKVLRKLIFCRVDNCESKAGDRRDIPVREGENDEAATSLIEGDSKTVMYECREGTTPAGIVEQASRALRVSGFDVPYQFVDKEASLTAHKDDIWLMLDAASRYYTLVELKVAPPDLETFLDAGTLADAIERNGHVALYGVHFMPGRADMAPESVIALREVSAMLEEHPEWRLRIEGHTDSTGTKTINQALSARRATTVVNWLFTRDIKKARLEAVGVGDSQPIGDNSTEPGRAKNRRIELVKIDAPETKAQQ